MKEPEKKKRKTNPQDYINEAKRYMENALNILKEKGGLDDGYYWDSKYVKMAGDIAWKGVLLALEGLMRATGNWNIKKGTRPNVDTYREFLADKNRKVLSWFNTAYPILHLEMGYDGVGNVKLVKLGFEMANNIIEWVERSMPKSHQ